MWKRYLLWGVSALVVLGLGGFGGWLLSLQPATQAVEAPAVPQAETDAMMASLKPPEGRLPLVAVIGINDATETTDYLTPTGILRRADIADVKMLATGPGPVVLYPALSVEPDETVAEFDAQHPEGADYVIVPAMSRDDDPLVLAWLREQAAKGARIIGVCAGAKVVAATGLLDGRRATTHWYYLAEMLKDRPTIRYVKNRRMVSDGNVVTTTGITASVHMMLTLIEAIAGRGKADAIAAELGSAQWNAGHASGAFRLTRPFAITVLANRLAFWKREELEIRLEPGMDEVSLALAVDAWSRTYRSSVRSFSPVTAGIVTANGVRVFPDAETSRLPQERRISIFPEARPADALDQTLRAIATRHGARTASIVAMQLEYPQTDGGQ